MPWCNITQGEHRIRIHLRIWISVPPAAGCATAPFKLATSLTIGDDPLSHLFYFEKRWGVDKLWDAARSFCRSARLRVRIHLRIRSSILPAAGCTTAPFNLANSSSDDPLSHLFYIEKRWGADKCGIQHALVASLHGSPAQSNGFLPNSVTWRRILISIASRK